MTSPPPRWRLEWSKNLCWGVLRTCSLSYRLTTRNRAKNGRLAAWKGFATATSSARAMTIQLWRTSTIDTIMFTAGLRRSFSHLLPISRLPSSVLWSTGVKQQSDCCINLRHSFDPILGSDYGIFYRILSIKGFLRVKIVLYQVDSNVWA